MSNDQKNNLSFSVLDVLPYADEFFATMEGTVSMDLGLGKQYYMFTFHHDGERLEADGEPGSSARQLIRDLEQAGLSETESLDRAWEIMREVAAAMYSMVQKSALHEPGMEKFARL